MLEQWREKLKAVYLMVASVEHPFGEGSMMSLANPAEIPSLPSISTGSLGFDAATGIGGYPRGRVVEIFGPESSGKTTLALHALAEAQKAGGMCAFLDAEHALDVAYAYRIGVDPQTLFVSQPDTGEQALEIAEKMVRSGAIDLLVVDSVAALTPKEEIEGSMADSHRGLQARLMSQALRKLTAVADRTGTTLVFLNQLRHRLGSFLAVSETTSGGNALKFYASMRVDVRPIGHVKRGEEVIGGRSRVRVVKNKCASPFAEATFDITWRQGIDHVMELVDLGLAHGLLASGGGALFFRENCLGKHREQACDLLRKSPEMQEALREAVVLSLHTKRHECRAAREAEDPLC